MRGVIMHAPGDVRVEDRENPTIVEPTDAIIRVAAILHLRIRPLAVPRRRPRRPHPMGHEYVGVVTEIGADVKNVKIGDFVVGSFFASDNTCEICRAGYQSRCVHATGLRRHPGRVRPHPPRRRNPRRHPRPARRRPDPVAARRIRRARHRMVRRRRRRSRPGQDRRGRRRRRRRTAGNPRRPGARRRADHRDEPSRRPAGARPRVRRDRHRRGARRRGRGEDQRAHRRARRAQCHRSRRHPGVDDAGDPRHPPRRARRLRRRLARRVARRASSCSSPACTCTAARPRCAASCPSSSS